MDVSRNTANRASVRRRSSSTEKLALRLVNPHARDRERLCNQLFREAGASAFARKIFLGLLGDRDPNIRACSAMYLGSIGGPGVQRALIGALSDRDQVVRSCAVRSLGLIGSAAVGRRLEAIVADRSESPRIRGDALEALATLPFRRASKTVIRALGDRDAEVRFFAANAAANLGLVEAIPVLEALAHAERATIQDFGSVREEMCAAIKHLVREQLRVRTRKHARRGSRLLRP